MDEVYAALERCAIFVAIGTSGLVYPAAAFVEAAAAAGALRTIELNLDPCATSPAFRERRLGPASELVPVLVEELLA
jgi:NAD-dependent deacetylase